MAFKTHLKANLINRKKQMPTNPSKTIKEIVTDIGGNTTIEFSDDSLQQYNIKDVVTSVTNPVTGGISLQAGGASPFESNFSNTGAAGVSAAITAKAQQNGSGYSDTLQAIDAFSVFNSSDTSNTNSFPKSVYAVRMQAKNIGSGSVTHAIGAKVNAPVNSGGGTIDAAYGFYIAPQSGSAGISDSSALHIQGAGSGESISFSGGNGAAITARLYSTGPGVMRLEGAVLGLGSTPAAFQKFVIGGVVNGGGGNAIGMYVVPTLTAGANNDVLTAVYISPTFNANGKTGVKSVPLHVNGLSAYANNAAAVAAGLNPGAFYRTGGDPDLVCVVH